MNLWTNTANRAEAGRIDCKTHSLCGVFFFFLVAWRISSCRVGRGSLSLTWWRRKCGIIVSCIIDTFQFNSIQYNLSNHRGAITRATPYIWNFRSLPCHAGAYIVFQHLLTATRRVHVLYQFLHWRPSRVCGSLNHYEGFLVRSSWLFWSQSAILNHRPFLIVYLSKSKTGEMTIAGRSFEKQATVLRDSFGD